MISLGTDLGLGQPMEHVLRQCLIALRLAERLGLDEAARDGRLLRRRCSPGSAATSTPTSRRSGSATTSRSRPTSTRVDIGGRGRRRSSCGTSAPAGRCWSVLGSGVAFLGDGPARPPRRCSRTTGWPPTSWPGGSGSATTSAQSLKQTFERWDGKGAPAEATGERDPAAVAAGEPRRRGRGLPPRPAASRRRSRSPASAAARSSTRRSWTLFCRQAPALFGGPRRGDDLGRGDRGRARARRSCCPTSELDDALRGDRRLRRPQVAVHDRPLARRGRPRRGGRADRRACRDGDAMLVRRAGLRPRPRPARRLQRDLGQAGRRSPPAELERVRLHPYLTERMLASSPALAPLGAIAVQHHERLDGSGYPRGLSGDAITPAGRILAAADVYRAMTEPRPHRAGARPPRRPRRAARRGHGGRARRRRGRRRAARGGPSRSGAGATGPPG